MQRKFMLKEVNCYPLVILFLTLINAHPSDIELKSKYLGKNATDPDVTSLMMSAKGNHKVIKDIGMMNDERSQAALLRIAYGEIGGSYVRFAANTYVRHLREKCHARALLLCENDEACESGLAAIHGCPVDEELIKLLKCIFLRDSCWCRYQAASYCLSIPTNVYSKPMTDMIVDSMKTSLGTSDINKFIHTDYFYGSLKWTVGEFSLNGQAQILASMPGITLKYLSDNTPIDSGTVRDYFLIARAYAKDRDVKNDIKRILKTAPTPGQRASAMHAFEALADNGDVEYLTDIEKTDDYKCIVEKLIREEELHKINNGLYVYPIRFHARKIKSKLLRTTP